MNLVQAQASPFHDPERPVRLIEFPTRADARGALSFLEEGNGFPFPVKRLFYLHGLPPGAQRGGHAHRRLEQLLIAIAGRFTVTLDDGAERRHYALERPSAGLYIPPMTWTELSDFSPGAVCLALASDRYEEADYLRQYEPFVRLARGAR